MREMREVSQIIIHCSATPPSMDIGVDEIRQWHLLRGFSDIGYHYVIRRDGVVEPGRHTDVVGAHVQGHNAHSIGVCVVGGVTEGAKKPDANFTRHQWRSLETLVSLLVGKYPAATVTGHRSFTTSKACPSFDAVAWWALP